MPQIHADVAAIVAEVEQLTMLKSRWSGRVVIRNDVDASGAPTYLGAKPWNCDIVLHQSLLVSLLRYSTYRNHQNVPADRAGNAPFANRG